MMRTTMRGMTKKNFASALFLLALASALYCQDAPPTIYAESYRHDATRITEESVEMKLTTEGSIYLDSMTYTWISNTAIHEPRHRHKSVSG
jgi:hypothetical protein